MFARYALTALAVASGAMAQLMINSPASLVECQPSLISWSGGQGPYYVSVIPGGQPSAAALIDFGEQSGNQLTWTVNITAGTSVTYKVKDQSGTENFNKEVSITAGSSTACLNSAGTVVTGSAASSAAAATSMVSSAASSAGNAVSSASAAVSSAASSAVARVSSASSAAASGASSARSSGNVASSASSAVAGASSAAASAAPSGAAAMNMASKGGVVAMVVGVVGAALF